MNRKTFIAGEDLTDKIGYALKVDSGKVKLATVAGAECFGVIMNDNKVNMGVGVALTGDVCKAKLGGTVAMGDILSCDANGKLIKQVVGESTPAVVAKALEGGVANDLIYVVVK